MFLEPIIHTIFAGQQNAGNIVGEKHFGDQSISDPICLHGLGGIECRVDGAVMTYIYIVCIYFLTE